MSIAILAAMPEEIKGINTLGLPLKSEIWGNREFFHRQINTINFTSVCTLVGKVAAAQTASMLITHYKPKYVIFIGTAGALDHNLNIGDIVISEKLFQYDVDLRPFRPRFELGISGKTFFYADKFLIESAFLASEIFIKSTDFSLKQNILKSFGIIKPKITKGIITSGDSFFSSSSQIYREDIQKNVPEILATEMEGAAVAQVCEDLNVPFVVIRFISDKANKTASIDHHEFTSKIAAWYGKGIIENLIHTLT